VVSLTGRLLVATPALFDPNFAGTVLLVCQHDEDGALGLVLNRPSPARAAEFLPDWAPLLVEPAVVFVGGPVQQEMAIGLCRSDVLLPADADDEGLVRVAVGLALVDLSLSPDELSDARPLRVFTGYAGWSPGQLESEIEEGAWFVITTEADDALTHDPLGLRRRVLRRQGTRVSIFADYPADPTLN
jgi:putative transcriptional regulator